MDNGRTLYNGSTLHFPGPYYLLNVRYINVEPFSTGTETEGSDMFPTRYQPARNVGKLISF